jgi:hypothetical protein
MMTDLERVETNAAAIKIAITLLRIAFVAVLRLSIGFVSLSTFLAGPASADPAGDPCGLAMSFFCRLLPIAPDLDGDIDLTKELPPDDPAAPPPDSLPPADICARGCV